MKGKGGSTRLAYRTHETRAGEQDCHVFTIHVPGDLVWFQGHFDQNPVLPAVVQIHEALLTITETWPDLRRLRRITRGKFRRPIQPEDPLTLCIRRGGGKDSASFEYLRGDESCSSATLVFQSVEPGE